MKLILATVVVIASCLAFIAGSFGEEIPSTTAIPLPPIGSDQFPNIQNGRFFFGFGSGDPCTNVLYQMFGITDAKCSLQCYIQAGLQQGGYCDENNVCQCNQIA